MNPIYKQSDKIFKSD